MISGKLKDVEWQQYQKAIAQKRWRQARRKRSIEHFDEVIHGKSHKVFELERTEEGDTKIRKIRL